MRLIRDHPHPAASLSTVKDFPDADPSPCPDRSPTDAEIPDVSAPADSHSDLACDSAEARSPEPSDSVTGSLGRLDAVMPWGSASGSAGSVGSGSGSGGGAEVVGCGAGVGTVTWTLSSPETVASLPSAMGQEIEACWPFVPPTVVHWLVERAFARAASASWRRASASALAFSASDMAWAWACACCTCCRRTVCCWTWI